MRHNCVIGLMFGQGPTGGTGPSPSGKTSIKKSNGGIVSHPHCGCRGADIGRHQYFYQFCVLLGLS